MPFTLIHAVVAVPLRRILPAAPLAAGAMVPDLPYFVPSGITVPDGPWFQPLMDAGHTHRVQADALVADVVLALVLAGVMTVCAAPARALLPQMLARRMGRRGPAWAARWAWWPVAAVVGITTHLVWDGLNHWMADNGDPALLKAEGVHLVGSLIALAAVGSACWWLWRRPLSEPVSQPGLGARLGLLAAMGLVAAGLVTMKGAWAWTVPRSLVTSTIAAIVLVLLAYAAFRRLATSRAATCPRRVRPNGPSPRR
ncbi:DUF4184 family protein [Streptosporangium sp. NPDC023615]|uniref:DUF4184 family protein n=1 Tax=Streptosporangium sp. NPDC023615 TaxID=3154794 RepID=UPI003419044D